MAITFTKKRYTCSNCGYTGTELLAIAKISDLSTGYSSSDKPKELKQNGIYLEQLIRDEYGIVLTRVAYEKSCPSCQNCTLVADRVDNEDNVLNFYPRTEAHKWLDGFGKAGL